MATRNEVWQWDNFVGEKTETGQRKDPRFPRASLSKFNEILEDRFCPLDNNAAESFNKNFAAPLPQSPSIWKIISQFKKEEALAQYKILQSVNGAQGSQDNAGRKNNMRKQRDEIHKILKFSLTTSRIRSHWKPVFSCWELVKQTVGKIFKKALTINPLNPTLDDFFQRRDLMD